VRVAFPISSDPRNLPCPQRAAAAHRAHEGAFMLDIVMLAMGLGFFVLAVGYTYACERL
jgi:hypothetical protein